MDLILLTAYVLLLLLQIFLLIRATADPSRKNWVVLLCVELASLLAAVALMFIFDHLPGEGMMPGLTWFTEVISSMGAAVMYGIMLVLSLILKLIRKNK